MHGIGDYYYVNYIFFYYSNFVNLNLFRASMPVLSFVEGFVFRIFSGMILASMHFCKRMVDYEEKQKKELNIWIE